MPSSEMTTVQPANSTARPDVSSGSGDRAARVAALGQPLRGSG